MPAAEDIVLAVAEKLAKSGWYSARCPGCGRGLMNYRAEVLDGDVMIDRTCPRCKQVVRLHLAGPVVSDEKS